MHRFRLPSCAIPSAIAIVPFLLLGCASVVTIPNSTSLTGNWQLSSSSSVATQLPSLSGELKGSTGSPITGVLHSDSASACVSPSMAIDVTGSTAMGNQVTLTGNVAGGTLTVNGTLAADGKSLSEASYNVSGGACSFAKPAAVTAHAFASITGTYTGSFSDPDGVVISISAQLTQTPEADTDGNFQLSGTATLPANPCYNSPVTITSSQVTGGSFTLTYADPNTQNSTTASGTFSTDGSTLTVTNWTSTGTCGSDSGTGVLTQSNQ